MLSSLLISLYLFVQFLFVQFIDILFLLHPIGFLSFTCLNSSSFKTSHLTFPSVPFTISLFCPFWCCSWLSVIQLPFSKLWYWSLHCTDSFLTNFKRFIQKKKKTKTVWFFQFCLLCFFSFSILVTGYLLPPYMSAGKPFLGLFLFFLYGLNSMCHSLTDRP